VTVSGAIRASAAGDGRRFVGAIELVVDGREIGVDVGQIRGERSRSPYACNASS
jgi:hypothetical protein